MVALRWGPTLSASCCRFKPSHYSGSHLRFLRCCAQTQPSDTDMSQYDDADDDDDDDDDDDVIVFLLAPARVVRCNFKEHIASCSIARCHGVTGALGQPTGTLST